jgi:hypothetical protein
MKVVMDSDVLIKLTKAGSKEFIIKLLEVSIPKRVQEETVIEPKGYPDAKKIQKNIDSGRIRIVGPSNHNTGELEALSLYSSGGLNL